MQMFHLAVMFSWLASSFLMLDKHPQHLQGLLVLTGISAGLSTWTKEEGWLLLAAILTARGIVLVLFRAGMRDIFQENPKFFSGYLPICLIMISFRIFAPPSTPFSRRIHIPPLLSVCPNNSLIFHATLSDQFSENLFGAIFVSSFSSHCHIFCIWHFCWYCFVPNKAHPGFLQCFLFWER